MTQIVGLLCSIEFQCQLTNLRFSASFNPAVKTVKATIGYSVIAWALYSFSVCVCCLSIGIGNHCFSRPFGLFPLKFVHKCVVFLCNLWISCNYLAILAANAQNTWKSDQNHCKIAIVWNWFGWSICWRALFWLMILALRSCSSSDLFECK